jgi:dynein heavy chain
VRHYPPVTAEFFKKNSQPFSDLADSFVEKGCTDLNWNSENITEFMQDLRAPVECLHLRIVQIQTNFNEIRDVMTTWAKAPLFIRKDGRKDATLCVEEREERTKKRYGEMNHVAIRIHE